MKKHIKLLLRTLISNNACVEAARTKEPKAYNYIAIIFVLFALFFAALPTCVTGFQQQGGSWIRGGTFAFDTAMRNFSDDTRNEGITFNLYEDEKTHQHKLEAKNWNKMPKYEGQDSTELYTFTSKNPDPEGEGEHKIMEIFVCPENYDFSLFVEEIAKNINPFKVHKESKDADEKVQDAWLEQDKDKDGNPIRKNRSTTFIVFGVTEIQGALYQPGGTAIASSVYGDYQNVKPNEDLIHNVLVTSNNPDDILKNCQQFFDQVYINPRKANTWKSTGIILGVDAGVVILMGFMVWVLTRGKNNPFRIYSFWDGQKIAYYACLTPGIISLFGFLMSNMAMMLFILGAGVRVMWLSMRTLRYQAPAK